MKSHYMFFFNMSFITKKLFLSDQVSWQFDTNYPLNFTLFSSFYYVCVCVCFYQRPHHRDVCAWLTVCLCWWHADACPDVKDCRPPTV